jgi:hypothetical protein
VNRDDPEIMTGFWTSPAEFRSRGRL